MKRARWLVVLCCVTTMLTGCGAVLGGTPLPQPIDTDPGELVTGPYPRGPMKFTPSRSVARGRYPALETQRMLAWLVPPTEIDPELNTNAGVEFFHWPPALTEVLPKYFVPVAERQLFLMGVSATRTNGSTRALKRGITMVLRFPDDNFARRAATEFAQAVKDNIPGARDRPDAIPEFPSAITVYHDGSPNISSFMTIGPLVVLANIALPSADYPQLAGQARKLLSAQAQRLRGVAATPLDDILDLPVNRDGLLDRALPALEGVLGDFVRDTEIGVYPAAAELLFARDTAAARDVFAAAGVDLAARHGGVVYRARDRYAAVRVQAMLARTAHRNDKAVGPPPGLPGAQCLEPAIRDSIRNRRYLCAVSHDRYAAIVWGTTLRDLWQKAAAQYAMLTGRT